MQTGSLDLLDGRHRFFLVEFSKLSPSMGRFLGPPPFPCLFSTVGVVMVNVVDVELEESSAESYKLCGRSVEGKMWETRKVDVGGNPVEK